MTPLSYKYCYFVWTHERWASTHSVTFILISRVKSACWQVRLIHATLRMRIRDFFCVCTYLTYLPVEYNPWMGEKKLLILHDHRSESKSWFVCRPDATIIFNVRDDCSGSRVFCVTFLSSAYVHRCHFRKLIRSTFQREVKLQNPNVTSIYIVSSVPCFFIRFW